MAHFVRNHLKSGLKGLDFELSDFQMVGTIAKATARPFENQIRSQDLNVSSFQMVRFQIPTVYSFDCGHL